MMTLIRWVCTFALFSVPAAFAATTSGSLTAAGQSSANIQVNANEQLRLTLSNTWSGVVAVQALRGSPALRSVAQFNANTSSTQISVTTPGEYRITALSYASGTIDYSAVTSSGSGGVANSADVIAFWAGTCNVTTFLRADGTCTAPSGSGDASTNTASSIDSEIALFSSTTGKLLKRASTSGILKGTSGVLSAAAAGTDYYAPGSTDVAVADGGTGASTLTGILIGNGTSAFTTVTAPSGAVVGTTDTQALTNKTIAGGSNTISGISLATMVTGNLPVTNLNGGTGADGTKFWAGDATWKTPPGGGTVNSGTQYQLAYYATSTTAVTTLGSLGTAGDVLQSSGAGAAPVWTTPASPTGLTAADDADVADYVLSIDNSASTAEKMPIPILLHRTVAAADATTITATCGVAENVTQANTQSTGTLTMANPTGTCTNMQRLTIRIKSTNVQTFSWGSQFRGSTDAALPTASSGATKTDYFGFIYNSADTKWDYVSKVAGF